MKKNFTTLSAWVKEVAHKSVTKKIAVVAIGTAIAGGGIYYVHRKSKKFNKAPTDAYVFFTSDGKPFVLNQEDVFTIKQKILDGVLLSQIAHEYATTPVMIARINSVKI